ncbi:MAG: DUF1003 domain-containing protein [Acidobacteriaceae bacterium]
MPRKATQQRDAPPRSVQENIRTIAALERAFEESKTVADRIASRIAAFSGSLWFVAVHLIWFVAWFVINTGHFPGLKPFDPYPFILLSMMVSVEAVLLSTFVLMKQNLMQRRTDDRDEMNLQIDLLSEKELTKALQVLRAISRKLEIDDTSLDAEFDDMSQNTSLDQLAESIRKEIPPEG